VGAYKAVKLVENCEVRGVVAFDPGIGDCFVGRRSASALEMLRMEIPGGVRTGAVRRD